MWPAEPSSTERFVAACQRECTVQNAQLEAALRRLARSAQAVVLLPKRPLFRRDEPAAGLFVVESGVLKVGHYSSEGREHVLAIYRAGRVVAEGLAGFEGRCTSSCFAVQAAHVWHVALDDVRAVLADEPALALWCLELQAASRERCLLAIARIALHSVEERLAAYIVECAQRLATKGSSMRHVPRHYTVDSIAALLGTTRIDVTRAQNRLRDKGLIQLSREFLEICDIAGLKAVAGGKVR